jgi:hypothetical protein
MEVEGGIELRCFATENEMVKRILFHGSARYFEEE